MFENRKKGPPRKRFDRQPAWGPLGDWATRKRGKAGSGDVFVWPQPTGVIVLLITDGGMPRGWLMKPKKGKMLL